MTDPETWRRVEAILDELLELEPSARPEALRRLAGDDAALRAHVERMLDRGRDDRQGVLERGVATIAAKLVGDDPEPPGAEGECIGPYRIVRELGRGGMGTVYLAERTDGEFEQHVALKLIRPGLGRDDVVERFRRERRILARLRHPNIAALYDGGRSSDGAPYFAMEVVEGTTFLSYCDDRRLGITARLILFESVCAAVAHAHRNLVVHRDLKPSNVLVTGDGTVKLLDFGIAKLLVDESGTLETQQTSAFLTPAYAAPEQVLGEPTTTATDIYALGTLLYELLTGHHPLAETSRPIEAARAIVEAELRDPSTRAGQDGPGATAVEIAERRASTPSALKRKLRGDLDDIVRMALERQPEDRFASVDALREDIERHRRSLPVSARRATPGYRIRKFARRHRHALAAGAAVLTALVVGFAGVAWQARVASIERDLARAVKDYLIEVFAAASPEQASGEAPTAVTLVELGASRIAERFPDEPHVRAEITNLLASVLHNLGEFQRADSMIASALDEHRSLGDPELLWESLMTYHLSAREAGKLALALERSEELLALTEQLYDPAGRQSLRVRKSIATTHHKLGRMDEAAERYRELDELAERAWAETAPVQLAAYRENYGAFLAERGEFVEAERIFRGAAAAFRELDQRTPLARVLGSLGGVVGEQGRLDESREILLEAVALARVEHGAKGHHALAIMLMNLGHTCLRLGDPQAADSAMSEGYDMQLRRLGPDHWNTGRSLVDLSLAKEAIGELALASELCDRGLDVMTAALGKRHPALAYGMTCRARYLHARRLLDASEAAYRDAIAFHREVLGEGNAHTAHPLLGLAELLEERGDLEEAEALHQDVVRIRTATFGDDNLRTLEARAGLGRVVLARGRIEDARAILDGVIAAAREADPAADDVLAEALTARRAIAD